MGTMLPTTAQWMLHVPVVHVKKKMCHLSMPSPTAARAGPACVQHALLQLFIVARPDLQFVYMCVLFCDILLPEVQSHSDDSHIINVTGSEKRDLNSHFPGIFNFWRFSNCHISTAIYGSDIILGTIQVITFN